MYYYAEAMRATCRLSSPIFHLFFSEINFFSKCFPATCSECNPNDRNRDVTDYQFSVNGSLTNNNIITYRVRIILLFLRKTFFKHTNNIFL